MFRSLLVVLVCVTANASDALKTELVDAINAGDSAKVQGLLDKGVSPNTRDPVSKEHALQLASAEGHVGVVEVLLKAGANIDAWGDDVGGGAHTALMEAVSRGRVKVVKALIKAGANVNARSEEEGWTALMQASYQGLDKFAKGLLIASADPRQSDNQGMTALMHACRQGRFGVAKILLDDETAKGTVNFLDSGGQTALMKAAYHDNVALITALIEAGANVNARDRDTINGSPGNSALSLSRTEYKKKTEKALIAAGAVEPKNEL